jgi:ribose 5-phosphate isomerase
MGIACRWRFWYSRSAQGALAETVQRTGASHATIQAAATSVQAPRPSVRPSAYQQAIIDWLITGTGNAIVDAKAGSGKTSTLCMLADCISRQGTRAAFLAFNKSIADELKRRLPSHVLAATWHSVGVGALRRMPEFAPYSRNRDWVSTNKVHSILDSMQSQYMDAETYRKGVKQLVGLMKANAMLPDVSQAELLTHR